MAMNRHVPWTMGIGALALGLCVFSVSAQELTPYVPSFMRPLSAERAAQLELEEERSRERRRGEQAEPDRKSSLEKVCSVLLDAFNSPTSLDGLTKTSADLLLAYHKAGVSCFEHAATE